MTIIGSIGFSTDVSKRTLPAQFPERITDGHQALVAAGLNFTVERKSLADLGLDHPYADKFYAGVRSTDGAILGAGQSKRFMDYQTSLMREMGDVARQYNPDLYFSAGGLSLDERTAFLALSWDSPDFGDGPYQRTLLMVNGFNGNRLFIGALTVGRLYCMNQVAGIIKGEQVFRLGHSWSYKRLIPTAISAVRDAVRISDEVDEEIKRLIETPISSVGEIVEKITSPSGKIFAQAEGRARTEWENRQERVWAEYEAPQNAHVRGTAWGLVMAAEAVDEHGSRVRHGRRDAQRVQRVIARNYPLMNRALAYVRRLPTYAAASN